MQYKQLSIGIICILLPHLLVCMERDFYTDRSGIPSQLSVVSSGSQDLSAAIYPHGLQVVIETFDRSVYAHPKSFNVYVASVVDDIAYGDHASLHAYMKKRTYAVGDCFGYELYVERQCVHMFKPHTEIKLKVSEGQDSMPFLYGVITIVAAVCYRTVFLPASWCIQAGAHAGCRRLSDDELYSLMSDLFTLRCSQERSYVYEVMSRQEDALVGILENTDSEIIMLNTFLSAHHSVSGKIAVRYVKKVFDEGGDCAQAFCWFMPHVMRGDADCCAYLLWFIFETPYDVSKVFGFPDSAAVTVGDTSESASIVSDRESESDDSFDEARLDWLTQWWYYFGRKLRDDLLMQRDQYTAAYDYFLAYQKRLAKKKHARAALLQDWITKNMVEAALGGPRLCTYGLQAATPHPLFPVKPEADTWDIVCGWTAIAS